MTIAVAVNIGLIIGILIGKYLYKNKKIGTK